MHPVVTGLERNGLIDPEQIAGRFSSCSYTELCRVWEDLHRSLYEARTTGSERDSGADAVSSLNLLAGCSIRGGHCAHCGPRKLADLARFAALYSDRVLVPFELRQPETDSSETRAEFAMRVISLTLLRPVIEADVLRVVLPEFHFCPECGKRARATLKEINNAIDELAEVRAKDFQLIYRPCVPERPFLEVRGPQDYIDHGAGILLEGVPPWAPKRLSDVEGSPGKVLPLSTIKRNKLLSRFVLGRLREDAVFQQLYGYRYGTKYLTDRPGEAELFRHVSLGDALYKNTAALCARLQHSVPLFSGLPLATILRIRRYDPGSFLLYRKALGKILQEHLDGREQVSDEDAISIYRDILAPELLRLRREQAAQARTQKIKMLAKTILPAAIVTLGVFSGFLPHNLAELAKVVGATSLLNQAGESLLDRNRPSQIRNHNLYFLLRLSEEMDIGPEEAV